MALDKDPVEGRAWFFVGLAAGISIFIFIILSLIFAAYNQPENFAKSYKDFFCYGLKNE